MRWRHLGLVVLVGGMALHCGGNDANPTDPADGGTRPPGVDGGHPVSSDGGKKGPDGAPAPGDDDDGSTPPPPGDDDSGSGGDATVAPGTCLPPHTDNVAPSINPPGGLAANKVPMFVMLGFDDNAHADGMNWVVKTLLGGKKNKDGSPAAATFFLIGGAVTSQNGGVFTPAGGQTEQDLIDSWKAAYDAGHEIGNHTWDHADGGDGRQLADWQTEISKSSDMIIKSLGIDKCQLQGWRFPYLHFDEAGFQAIQPAGFRYDTSIEFGYDWWQPPGMSNGFGNTNPEYGKHYWWPFTLDNGLDSSFACCSKGVGKHPGMWEFPVHAFTRPDPADSTKVKTVTGLDYNLWVTKASVDPSTDFCGTLKYSFDQRYNSNRSPFSVGAHSDIYSQYNPTDDSAFGNTYTERRAALKCFVDYVLTFPDARLVAFRDVVSWMRNPVAIH
jgi:hypothetical protein